MKALVLLSGLAPGGAEQVTVGFLTHLQRQGVPVTACTVTNRHDGPLAGELKEAGVDRRDLGARRLADPVSVVRLVRLLVREGIDVLHAHGQDASILASFAAVLRPTPLVVTRHVLEEPGEDGRQRARAALAVRACRDANVAVAVSGAVADALAALGGPPKERIRVIPNGIEVDRFLGHAAADSRAALRRELDLGQKDRLVLLPGILRAGKGHDEMLESLPLLLTRVPAVCLLLAGAGPDEERLRARAVPFGDRVRFLGHRTDMPALMAAAEVVVLPSRAEALPTVLMEAAAAGRPVVATRVGGVPEVVDHGGTGWVVPPNDPVALAEATAALLRDPTTALRLGEGARRRALGRFGLEHQVDDTLTLWEEVRRTAS